MCTTMLEHLFPAEMFQPLMEKKLDKKRTVAPQGGESDHPDAPWWLAAVLLVLSRYSSIPLFLLYSFAPRQPISPGKTL